MMAVTTSPRTFPALILACAVLAVGALALGSDRSLWILGPLTTLLIAAFAWQRGGSTYGHGVVTGLLLSLAGNLLLVPGGYPAVGLAALLLAHLAFLFAFTREVRLARHSQPFVTIAVVAVMILSVLWPALPAELQVPALTYVVVAGVTVAQAFCLRIAIGTRETGFGAFGAALFLASDVMLAIEHFHSPLPLAPMLILGTSYAAQLLIALSIPAESGDAGRPSVMAADLA